MEPKSAYESLHYLRHMINHLRVFQNLRRPISEQHGQPDRKVLDEIRRRTVSVNACCYSVTILLNPIVQFVFKTLKIKMHSTIILRVLYMRESILLSGKDVNLIL